MKVEKRLVDSLLKLERGLGGLHRGAPLIVARLGDLQDTFQQFTQTTTMTLKYFLNVFSPL